MEVDYKTYNFSSLDSIKNFQFYSENAGVLLCKDRTLYKFKENVVEGVKTPKEVDVVNAHFLNSNEGAVVGYIPNTQLLYSEAKIVDSGLLTLGIILIFGSLLLKHKIKVFQALILILICTACTSLQNITSISSSEVEFSTLEFSTGSHKYLANKDYVTPVILVTKDGGNTWITNKLPTNFYVTDIDFINRKLMVSTFANPYDGIKDRPIHGDGDLFVYNFDTFSENSKPENFSGHMGINGIENINDCIYLYGTERINTLLKKNQLEGNIYKLKSGLTGSYSLINTIGRKPVIALSISNSKNIWSVLGNQEEVIVDHEIHYKTEGVNKLILYKGDSWLEISLPEEPKDVIFYSDTKIGFVITKMGSVYKTFDEGNAWERIEELKGVLKGNSFKNNIAFLTDKNHILCF